MARASIGVGGKTERRTGLPGSLCSPWRRYRLAMSLSAHARTPGLSTLGPGAPGLGARDALLALAVVAVWGTNFVVIRLALGSLPPLLFAALRFTLAALPGVF